MTQVNAAPPKPYEPKVPEEQNTKIPKLGSDMVEVNIQKGGGQFIPRNEFEKLEKEAPLVADNLKKYGSDTAIKLAEESETYQKGKSDQKAKRIQQAVNQVLASARNTPNPAVTGVEKTPDKFKNWTADELKSGKTVDGVFIPSPYGVKGETYIPYPKWAKNKIEDSYKKALKEIEPHLVEGYTSKDVLKMLREGVEKPEVVKAAAKIGEKVIDVNGAVSAGKEKELKRLGVKEKTIRDAKMSGIREDMVEDLLKGIKAKQPEKTAAVIGAEIGREKQVVLEKEYTELAGELALRMLPVVGTVKDFQDFKKDGFTKGEIAWLAFDIGTDLLWFTLVAGAAAKGARATATLSRVGRFKGALKGAQEFAIADIKAPITMLRHPAETAKTALKTTETIVRRTKLPLAAGEVAYSTIRLPVKAFASGEDAMNVRDIATLAAMQEGKYSIKIGNKTVKLTPTILQKTSKGLAVHTTHDVRPFLEGATIQAGREGGLFVAPSLHTRFQLASAFGDVTQGQIPGALLIRDNALLKELGGSKKIYKGTAEIEALLKAGVKLPEPSQVLYTRGAKADVSQLIKDAKALRLEGKVKEAADLEKKAQILKKSGDKVALLVYGEPFSNAEIAKMKLLGASDTIKQIFTPPASLGVKSADFMSQYDELNDIRKQASELVEEAGRLKRAGKLDDARAVERQADELLSRAGRMVREIEASSAYAGLLRAARVSVNNRSAINRLTRIADNQQRKTPDYRYTLDSRGRIGIRAQNIVKDARGRARREPIELARGPRGRVEIKSGGEGRDAPIRKGGKAPPPTPPGERPAREPTERVRRTPPVPSKGRPPETPPPTKKFTSGMKSSAKREIIKNSGGAVAWRQGELNGKDIFHVIIFPYDKKAYHTILVGDKPQGATVFEGKESAFKSVKRLYGRQPNREIDIDMGIQDVELTPEGKNNVGLKFTPDPKQITKGLYSISKRMPNVSPKVPKLK